MSVVVLRIEEGGGHPQPESHHFVPVALSLRLGGGVTSLDLMYMRREVLVAHSGDFFNDSLVSNAILVVDFIRS